MNLNEQAIDLLERNEYDNARTIFQEAVQKCRDVQSLTNLAWILTNEEDDFDQAIKLLTEVMQMKPKSNFPYNLLGEVYMRKEMWKEAETVLKQALAIEPSTEAYFNLGATMYHLNDFEEAAKSYLASSSDSDYALYGYVRCLLNLDKHSEAKQVLDTFSQDADDFVGEVEVAEFYVELGCYRKAVKWYEKGFEDYYHQVPWVGRYIYSLLQLNQFEKAEEIRLLVLNEQKEALMDEQEEVCDEHWTEEDKQKEINKIKDAIEQLTQMQKWISNETTPAIQYDSFDPSISTRCYLFGCKRHDFPEYAE